MTWQNWFFFFFQISIFNIFESRVCEQGSICIVCTYMHEHWVESASLAMLSHVYNFTFALKLLFFYSNKFLFLFLQNLFLFDVICPVHPFGAELFWTLLLDFLFTRLYTIINYILIIYKRKSIEKMEEEEKKSPKSSSSSVVSRHRFIEPWTHKHISFQSSSIQLERIKTFF